MSLYEETTAPYFNGVSENNYFNNARLMDMCNLEHSWNTTSNYCADLKTPDCCHVATASAQSYYRSPSYCPGSSSELDGDMDKQFHDGLFTTISPTTTITTAVATTTTPNGAPLTAPPTVVRVIKKRNTANKKERRRTQSINNAFSCLREKIPNVPVDTKLSKIKTLKLAILYIKYLVDMVETAPFSDGEQQDPKKGFRADLKIAHRKNAAERRAYFSKGELQPVHRPNKGRTGWPQDVWAAELLPDQK